MKFILMLALAGVCGAGAMAQPVLEHKHDGNCCHEGFPPGSMPVPGVPGAMTHPDVPEGYVLIEGDIQVRLDEYAAYMAGADSTFGTVTFWPVAPIAFDFAANVNTTNQQFAVNAMNAISARVGVTFVPRAGQSNWIRFNDSTGNSSPVGMQGGQQTINMASWGSQFVIIHELYHSLGFWHEQSRPDRNTFVTINLQNVEPGREHNFDIRSGAGTYGFYDFDSFMHYGRTAFSVNGLDTITVNQPFTAQWQSAIGQRNHFSFFDEITCRGIYRFGFDRWWKPGAAGNTSGNLLNPMNNSTFAGAYNAAPAGTVLFIKDNANYPAVGTYSKAMTIQAPTGATLGN
ncbi:MAG: M12 family metallopeptidase [Phycisphaerales bacterium]